MSKSPDAFRTISEVADWLGVQAHVLRFWESRFTQVKPVKRAGGRRYYRPNDMRLLGGIKKLLHEDGTTIKGVQRILREQGVAHVASLSQPLEDAAEADVITQDDTVVPFTAPPVPPSGQIDLDLGDSDSVTPEVSARPEAAEAPATNGSEAARQAEPEYLDEAPLLGGIASQVWNRTEFDEDLLKQIAPVANELRALLNRIENRSAG